MIKLLRISTASFLLLHHVTVTNATLTATWNSCKCRWDDWQSWSKCDSDCFGHRKRERSVWTICDKFKDCATSDEAYEYQICNAVCQNGGTAAITSWSSCTCTPGYYGPCCTDRVHCGEPAHIANGVVSLSSAYYGGTATYSCHNNYQISNGDRIRKCQNNFVWSGSEPQCIFSNHCGSLPCKNGATCVNLLGDFRCECLRGWNGRLCENDIQPPVMTGCSDNVYINATESNVHYNWTAPTFTDRMNTELDVICNYPTSEFTFPWGDHTVQYVATKTSNGLVTECSFQIKVRPNPCEDLNVPDNGALLCNSWKTDYGRFCMITCHQNYTIRPSQSFYTWYVCGASGSWIASGPVPDCDVEVDSYEDAEYYHPEYSGYVFSSSCEDAVTTETLRRLYIKYLKKADGFSTFCSNNDVECVMENVEISCGRVNI